MTNVHIPYIRLTFGNKSFAWRGEEGRPDYFTSLSHKRYTEEANVLTVNLTYCPKIGENPNSLEDAIVASGGQCLVQYGDLGEVTNLYKGLVHSYKVDFVEGVLAYQISMISSMVCYTYEQYPGCELSEEKGHSITDVENEIKKIVEKYMSITGNDFKSYVYSSGVNFKDKVTFSSISVPSGNPITALKSIIRQLKVRKLWKSEEDEIKLSTPVQSTIVAPASQISPRRPVEGTDAAGGSSSGSTTSATRTQTPAKFNKYNGVDHSLDYHLALEIDESGSGKSKVRVVLISNDASVASTYVFEWGDKNSEVLSWSPEYDGIYSIHKARGNTMFDTYLSTNKEGEYGYTTFAFDTPQVIENGVSSDLFAQVENLKINQSEVDRHYEYKATLTVLGKSKMMDLGTSVIKVIPIVAGAYHHTAGDYVVIGVEDNVSSEGFTTTYTLYKSSNNASLFGTKSKGTKIYYNGQYIDIDDYSPESGEYSSNPCPIYQGPSDFSIPNTDWSSECTTGNFYLKTSQRESNAAYIWFRLGQSGWTMESVAAMLGNFESESSINPGIWQGLKEGNLSGGFGLAQWTPATKYINWCKDRNIDPSDMESALSRIEYEEKNGLQWAKSSEYPLTFSQFKTSKKDVKYLANAFLYNYERPLVKPQPARCTQAEKWYSFLKNLSTADAGWIKPCAYLGVTSPFGTRIHPITKKQSFHNGVDLGASSGTPIYASRSGTVTTAVYSGSWGNYVQIDHGDGFSSLYAHMTKFVVSNGQKVKQGQVIGYVGSTGQSTGPHLHFTIYNNGTAVDPKKYVDL